ncbi:N-6 DNA methylase [bacterium]|nr:N-6 DNA methylase [bacterium]
MSTLASPILGRVETPPDVARELARAALAGLAGDPLRVLDPACGAGALLLAASRAARELGKGVRLSGLEKDPLALADARETLGREGVRATLRSGDALERWSGRAERHPVGFDAILANPPWVSFSGRERVAISPRERERLRGRFESFRGWPSLQGPFLELALDLVRPGGRVGFVLPRAALELARYGVLRRVATARARVLSVRDLGEFVFPGVCQPAATVVLERALEGEAPRSSAGDDPWLPASPLEGHESALPRWALLCLSRLARFPRLPREIVSDPGVHTGNAASLVLSSEPGPGSVPCREGKDIRAFALALPRLHVSERPSLEPPLYATVRPAPRYREAAVLVRQTADRPIAARHEPWAFFRNSALALARGEAPVEVTLALLNSRLLALAHRARCADARQRAFPQVKVSALASLPFPAFLPGRKQEEIASLARRRERIPGRAPFELEVQLERAACSAFGLGPDSARALVGWLP